MTWIVGTLHASICPCVELLLKMQELGETVITPKTIRGVLRSHVLEEHPRSQPDSASSDAVIA